MENYMLDGFRKQLDANINYDPKREHASSIERNQLNIDFSNTPYVIIIKGQVTRTSVEATLAQKGYTRDPEVKVFASNPMAQISN